MTTTVQSIVDKLSDNILNDSNNTRWSEAELLSWANEAQIAIANAVSDAVVTISDMALVAGVRQTAPSDCIRIIDIASASDDNGTTRAPIVRKQKYMAAALGRTMYSATATNLAKEWYYDDSVATSFEVYPPSAASNATVEVVYNNVPAVIANLGANITIADQYAAAIVDYAAYRAFSKDTEDVSPDLGRATAYYNAFGMSVGIKQQGDVPNDAPRLEP